MFPDFAEVGKYFHEMFRFRWDEYRRSGSISVVNPTKRRKKFADEEGLIYKPLDFEIFSNISTFGMFEISRLAVFEKLLRRASHLHLHLQTIVDSSADCSSPSEDVRNKTEPPEVSELSKVVTIGVRTIFELIKGSKTEYPDLCVKAVTSLFTILEGLRLEALCDEPSDIVGDIFNVLLSVVDECLNEEIVERSPDVKRLIEISSACLLSFAIIRGDTGKMLRAISTILISKYSLSHSMVLPNAVIELQKSVQSVITGKLKHPNWFTHGVLKTSCISTFHLLLTTDDLKLPLEIKNIACDGYFLYLYTTLGLYKIGTGYNGTIPRNIYAHNAAFFGQDNGWICFIKNTLYFMLIKQKGINEFYSVNKNTLELHHMIRIDTNVSVFTKGLLFVDGDYLCSLSSPKEDELIIRSMEITENNLVALPEELRFHLSEKYFKLFGSSCGTEEKLLSSHNVGVNEELISFTSGKEFSLLQTSDGKVLYNSKLGNQNLRAPGSRTNHCWVELICPKMSAVKQCVIGNDGSIGLLVYNDGSVYFIGFARRGEDGENGAVRRQCNQIKPRKMTRMEGKNVVYAACNHGSTALVTDKGELFMFGKDAIHCDAGTGYVSDLKQVRVRSVALGKVHVVVLTDKGHVYTFGYNGRGQCGRYSSSEGPGRTEAYMEVFVEDDENSASSDDTYSDVICLKGTHIFKQDKCMICPICHQCTGYGAGCLASNEGDREPGEECGCGDGDSGCAKCCICKICAFEEDPDQELDDENDADDIIRINLFGAVYERNDRKVRAELFKRDEEQVAGPSGENRIKSVEMINNSNGGKDSMSMVYLLPAKVHFRSTAPAVQIAAGLYHTVVLTENGEVYTFGSNTSGQLGISDENHVGPVKANLPPVIVEIAAGSNHTVALTATGEVYTFGNNSKNQLGRNCVTFVQTEGLLWHSTPQLIPNVGSQYPQKVTGIGASGDLTYLKISKSLLNRSILQNSTFVADSNNILLLPIDVENNMHKPFECVVIKKKNGSFKSFGSFDQVNFTSTSVCFDSLYNVLWCVQENDVVNAEKGPVVNCYNVIASDVNEEFCSPNILDCELAVPVVTMHSIPCYQAAIHVLACLDMLAQARSRKDSFKSLFMEQKRVINTKSLRKEDFTPVNRFQGLGNSWTYNAHNAVEAIRFSCDTDVLLGGIGLYGGRGHYHARLKLLDIGFESDPEPKDGQLLINTDEIVYECSLKQTYPFMFEEPVLLEANRWYIIWAQIKGSPSDCGSSGQPYLVTDDEVVFHFKSSLLSNNGTNVSSGQIPQLFYKVLLPEFYVVTNLENPPSAVVHILSRKFSHTVTEDGFKSLINLLSWCWEAFKAKYSEISNLRYSPSLLEVVRQFDKLVYINQACQHLIRAFIFEMYPDDCRVRERRFRMNYIMAELIGDVRELLQNILSDPFLFEHFIPKKIDGSCNIFYKLVKHIIKECSNTFVTCFYVFYPTPTQKWIYLSYLLTYEPENEYENDFLITSTLSALCASNICLKMIFPILLGGFDPNQLYQDKKNTFSPSSFYSSNPILAETMMNRTESEIPINMSSWLHITGSILEMAAKPVKDTLNGIKNYHDSKIALNGCQILSKLVAELSADAMGINDEVQRRKEQMLHTTPLRFRRVNANRSWNTGNGSPDAICFTVDKPGVVIVGVATFGGSGNYDYEIELLDEITSKSKNNSDFNLSNPHANWRCIALCRGSFSSSDYSGKDIVELNFEYPTAIQENTKYIIKMRLRGNRTNNGELGQAVVTGPDDTVFNFISTEISFNGTSVSRGQLPYIIYYRYPQRSAQELRQKMFVENQAHEAIMTISNRIFSEVTSILAMANELPNYKDAVDILIDAPIITALVPLLVTHLSPLVALNAKISCQVLKLIEELLPLVCRINKQIITDIRESNSVVESLSSAIHLTSNFVTTSPHYSLVESDHPYKRATVSKYIVKFPESVLWLSLEFDPRCGTAQEEDVLKIYVPDFPKDQPHKARKVYRPLPRTYGNNKHAWPGTAIILPGNEVIFSLESASKYLSQDRGTTFGFRCQVIGFEMVNIDGIPRLELELTSLACRCASYLIKKNFTSSDDNLEGINTELAEAEYNAHPGVLGRGMNLYRESFFDADKSTSFARNKRMLADISSSQILSESNNRFPLLNQAMDQFPLREMIKPSSTNTSADSNEHSFLMDFVHYKNDTSGGRLARWLQPDSFADVSKCEVIFPRTKIKCGWPTSLAVVTRDQYGDIVEVPDLKVKVECIPQQKEVVTVNDPKCKEDRTDDKPVFSVPYKPTIVNKVRYSVITFMKEYSDYSFEELRYLTPTICQDSEHLVVQSNHNGIHTANWTPAGVGLYSIHVTVDGYPMKELDLKVDVKDTPHGQSPSLYSKTNVVVYVEKKLRFAKQYSAGLRIRAQPSLQSEAVGFVPCNEIVTYNDEIENEDGVWVKLTHECIKQFCKQLFPEAWCLKYHKQYDFELLHAVVNQNNSNVPEKITVNNDIKVYRVVKCGVSGHNIRAYPSLKAPTVGMIFSDQNVTSDEQIYNKEGMWIKLDKEAMKKFELKQYDNVWSLAVDKSQIVYLRSDFSINKDMFLKALKWDEISGKVIGTEIVDSSSTSSDDSDNDHNHNPFTSDDSKQIYAQASKETTSTPPKKRCSRTGRTLSVSPKPSTRCVTDEEESTQERGGNQNVNLSVPPTPKKKRLGENVPKTTTTTLARMTSTSDLADSSSSASSRANTPQYSNFFDKFDKGTDISVFRVSSMSDSSGAVSTSSGGYQASIDTSSDSANMFKSKISFEEMSPILTQTGTQTSPKIFPKLTQSGKSEPSLTKSQEGPVFSCVNVNLHPETRKSAETEVSERKEAGKRLETDRVSRSSDEYSYEGMDSDDDLPSGIDDGSSEDERNGSIIESPLYDRIKVTGVNEVVKEPVASTSQDEQAKADDKEPVNLNITRDDNKVEGDGMKMSGEWEKYYCIKDSKIKYKTGIRPSVAESVRAVFAAFLWHEGLVHDAMTCASYLKFQPHLRKDFGTVVRRGHSSRSKDATLRYSVEVGLIGNDHHLIKPSTMKSLPSNNNDSPHKTNAGMARSEFTSSEKAESSSSPLALECVVTLWNEISSTCFQLFSKNPTRPTTSRSGDEKDLKESTCSSNSGDSEENKKCVYKLPLNFYKRFGTEEICELCNGKFPSPVTYHMKSVHKGCGKSSVIKGYTAEGKYTAKLKGNCGEGGVKGSPWYVLCDACRERHMQYRKFKTTLFQRFSPLNEDTTSGSSQMHVIMKENAMFALELSGNYNKLLPMTTTMPKLKTFGCLAAFGIDGDGVPNEMSSFAVETRRRVRVESDAEDGIDDDGSNTVKAFHRSMSVTGESWKLDDDDSGPSSSVSNKRYSAMCDLEGSGSGFSSMCQPSSKLQNVLKDMKNMKENCVKEERPIITFLKECHNLECLRTTMRCVMQKAICKNYGLRAMDWLLRTVTMPIALHDIMWWFVSSFSVPLVTEDTDYENDNEWKDEFDLTRICEHPLVDMALAGECRQQIPASFHTLLQTIADLMMIFPIGSPLQQMAIKCWGFQFTHSDYNFLHRSKLFVNISKILSRSESEEEPDVNTTSLYESHLSTMSQSGHYIEVLQDITSYVSVTVSSQSHQIANLIDNSTETYWESGEDDRRKMKTIVINCPPEVDPRLVYLHVDNTRDPNHKVLSVMILTGMYADSPHKLKTINLDADYCGWVTTFIPEPHQRMIRIDCKGDNVLRIRQIKVTGEVEGDSPKILQQPSPFVLQQRQCESETLKVFRLIIFQVFGELIETCQSESQRPAEQRESSDLKEHMVGILFSRRKLNNLQKQVCSHIVQTIKKETYVIKEGWEKCADASVSTNIEFHNDVADSYCFEMLCMVSALSGSDVGRSYLAQQYDLISDLLTLLHVGTARLQRQVVLLLRRVLPEVSPVTLARITNVKSLPSLDFHVLASTVTSSFDMNRRGILDIFLAVIAKILSIQVKSKNGCGGNGKGVKTVSITDYLQPSNIDPQRWYLKGSVTKELAGEIDTLLKDMASGKICDSWQDIAKAAIAENLLNLANLSKIAKDRNQCLKYATFWIGLSSLCGVERDHVEKLSSANWKSDESGSSPRPMCSNHDDGKTLAIIQCGDCGLLCLECDRFLHLSRKASHHERKVCKEEEEAIKVDVHEGCGRIKLFWLLALVDSNTFKGVVEFRENTRLTGTYNRTGVSNEMCRFCGHETDKLTDDGICSDEECQQHAANACSKVHICGHVCGGIKSEETCLPCLQGCSSSNTNLKQDADDMCMICFTEALSAAPSIQLECGHVFHYHCCESVLLKRWPGPRITFNFQQCPICKRSMYHESMKHLLTPIWDLMKDVRKKALMRLEYEGCPSNYEDPATYAMEKYAYYVCFKCKKAYYGGEARCEAEVDNSEFNPEELICGGCSDISGARVCPKHGTDFLEYKCRYCCSVAVYFCFGTTHFCNACHEDFQNVISLLPSQLPGCPAGPKGTVLNVEDCPLHIEHPPTGEEFALGCGVCRTGRNF